MKIKFWQYDCLAITSYKNITEYKKLINNLLQIEISDDDDRIIKNINNDLICFICFNNTINICINPCGHTFCDKCVEHMKDKCYTCNGNVKDKIKL